MRPKHSRGPKHSRKEMIVNRNVFFFTAFMLCMIILFFVAAIYMQKQAQKKSSSVEFITPDEYHMEIIYHEVEKGETLTSLAKEFADERNDVTRMRNIIYTWNGLRNPNHVEVGQTLMIPVNVADPFELPSIGAARY